MAKSEYCMLAHVLDPDKHYVGGSYISNKLDGVRCIYDGGISRGRLSSTVPYCNTHKDKKEFVATGLWSRTGKVIAAPDWFLDKLPNFPLDAELWCGYKSFQQLTSIVNSEIPDDRWKLVEYKIFDSPSWEALFAPRNVKVRNDYSFHVEQPRWNNFNAEYGIKPHWHFELVHHFLKKKFPSEGQISLLPQIELPLKDPITAIEKFTEHVLSLGGEGSIIRKKMSFWKPERSWDLLKFKPYLDAEGVVVGYYAGRETDKGSKLLGMLGALELDWQGAIFKISGFTDEERRLTAASRVWATTNPGSRLPDELPGSPIFPVGSRVTFTYRELSDDGVPKEARYLRKHNDL